MFLQNGPGVRGSPGFRGRIVFDYVILSQKQLQAIRHNRGVSSNEICLRRRARKASSRFLPKLRLLAPPACQVPLGKTLPVSKAFCPYEWGMTHPHIHLFNDRRFREILPIRQRNAAFSKENVMVEGRPVNLDAQPAAASLAVYRFDRGRPRSPDIPPRMSQTLPIGPRRLFTAAHA